MFNVHDAKIKNKVKPYTLYLNVSFRRKRLAGATSASAVNTLHDLALLQFAFWDTANTIGAKVCVPCLNTSQAAEVFIALLPPLGNQVLICYFFLQAVIVQFSTDSFPAVEEIIDVTRTLVVYSEDRP